VTRMIGARMPIWAYVGRTPTSAVAPPMRVIVTRKVNFRPMMSPIRPSNASNANGVYVPAMKTKIMEWSSRRAQRRRAVLFHGNRW